MFMNDESRIMKHYLIALIILFYALPCVSLAEEGWTRKADMPTARYNLSTSVVNGKIYAIGGLGGGQRHKTVEEYNPDTDSWTRKADMPTGRSGLTTFVVNGKIYAISGAGSAGLTRAVEAYDPATDTWTSKADIPMQMYKPGGGVFNGKIYTITGFVQIYDPATDTWTVGLERTPLRRYTSVSIVNGKFYFLGGYGGPESSLALPTVDEYDPLTDIWTRKADMPTARGEISSTVVNGKIYAIGGSYLDNVKDEKTVFSVVEVYDPMTDTWTEMTDLQVPRSRLSACTLRRKIYAIGGDPLNRVVEVYDAGPWGFAADPSPANGVLHLNTWSTLAWIPGDFAISHDIYFGDNFDDVNAGVESMFQSNQEEDLFLVGIPGFAYPDGLVPGTTYYWRVDEVNDLHPDSPWKGPVWSFSIPPKTAYSPDPADGSESVDLNVELGWSVGLDAKLHKVYFGESFEDVNNATDGTLWATTTYSPGPLKFAKTYYWRVDELLDSRGVQTYKGDIWSFTTEGAVGDPKPSDEAMEVESTQILTWIPGYNAASHEMYFGTDVDAVRNANKTSPEYKQTMTLGQESYDPGRLQLETTYYWRIDEVNSIHPDSPWKGPVWNFTTGDFIVVDDFEDYNISDNQIWWSWKDGLGYFINDNEPPYPGNSTGSVVGDQDTNSYCEEIIVHRGKQSMPYWYNNNKQGYANYSEAELTLTTMRDWIEEGVTELSLWFRGYPASLGSFTEGTDGTFTINAEGTRIGWTSDECYFSYKALSGPGSIVARLDSIEGTLDAARAAVMIRETLDPDSMSACAYIIANGGVEFYQRESKGSAGVDTYQPDITAPRWLKLERDVFGTFRAFHSADGSNWQPVENSAPASIPMRSDVYIGLAVASYVGDHTCEAVFSNVTFTGDVSSEWTNQDIGILSNDAETLYVAIANSDGEPVVVYHDEPAATNINTWTEWIIPLQIFADQDVILTDVDRIAIGIGTQDNVTIPGGSGKMYFDDIRLRK